MQFVNISLLMFALVWGYGRGHDRAAQAPPAPAAAAENPASAGHRADAWSLKGIGLRSTPDDFRAKFPNATCKSFADPLILDCKAPTTLSEQPAEMEVEYLRNQAVMVSLQRLNGDQLKAAVAALEDKYGPASVHESKWGWQYDPRARKPAKTLEQMRSRWIDGQIVIAESPNESVDPDDHQIYSRIILINLHLEGDEYIPRSLGKTPLPAADL